MDDWIVLLFYLGLFLTGLAFAGWAEEAWKRSRERKHIRKMATGWKRNGFY